MRISPVLSHKMPSNKDVSSVAFQRFDCSKPRRMSSSNDCDVFVRMAEASLSGTKRGQAIQKELQSMNLI